MEQLTRVTGATIAVLSALVDADEPCWGLALIKKSGRPAGSVYPILERLETAGWVSSQWEQDVARSGPRRRYYQLTDDGASAARVAITKFTAREIAITRPATLRVAVR
jgi:predicted transcriptional regulator